MLANNSTVWIDLIIIAICIMTMIEACILLTKRPQLLGLPLLLVSLVVILWWICFDTSRYYIILVWFSFLAALIVGYQWKRAIPWMIGIALAAELICTIITRNRPQCYFHPVEFALISLLSLGYLPFAFSLGGMLLSMTRSIWVGFAGSLLILKLKWHHVIAILVTLAGALVMLRPRTVAIRYIEWTRVIQAWWQSPWVGYGAGSYIQDSIHYVGTQLIAHCDNLPLMILYEFGIIGSLAFLYLLVMVIKQIYRCRPSLKRVGIIAVLIMQLFDAPLYFISGAFIFGLCLSDLLNKQ